MDRFQLKMFAIVLMVLDHLYAYLQGMPVGFAMAGRIVAPIFFFLLVDGFYHTRSRINYAARLLLWAVIMEIGSLVLQTILKAPQPLYNNIFWSLAFALLLLMLLDSLKNGQRFTAKISGVLALIIISIFTEASILGVVMTLVFYYGYRRRMLMVLAYIASSIGFHLTMVSSGYTTIAYEFQWMMVFAAPFLLLYNRMPGPASAWAKQFFYAFYPLHLWLLYVYSNWPKG